MTLFLDYDTMVVLYIRGEEMKVSEYITYDAVGLAELVKKGDITAKELAVLSFTRLQEVDTELYAVTQTRGAQVKEELHNLNPDAPLSGVPFYVKDISQTIEGEVSTGGSKLMQDAKASVTANLVHDFHEAGLVTLGYSATPEFALKNITEAKIHGPTRNPWNTNYSPGGSSGGAAALVASGVTPIAGASDGGGSIRIPASFTGLFGLKPTRGRTSVGPGVGRQWQGAAIDFVLTRSVRDSATMLTNLQTVQEEAAFQTPLFPGSYEEAMRAPFDRPLKIGFTTTSPVGTPVSDDAKKAVQKVVTWLAEQGHHVEEADNQIDGKQLMRHYYLMNSGEISSLTAQIETMLGRPLTVEDVEIETWMLHRAGQQVSAAEFTSSLAAWDEAAAKMAAFHQQYDFYITPASAFTAPKIGELTHSEAEVQRLAEQIETKNANEQQQLIYDMFLPSLTFTPFTQLANLTGQPGMSLPVHVTDEGLPLGVQVMASKGAEHRLLQLADKIEQSPLWVGMNGNPYFTKI